MMVETYEWIHFETLKSTSVREEDHQRNVQGESGECSEIL